MNRDFQESVNTNIDCPQKQAMKITEGEKSQIFVSFSYNPEFVAKVKTIPGHKYHSDKKYWSFPNNDGTLEKILKVFEGEEIQIEPALQDNASSTAGLRVGEVVKLKPEDIDSKSMLIHVRKSKGRKDRYTMLSETALKTLREYWKKYKPDKWPFEGAKEGRYLFALPKREHVTLKVFDVLGREVATLVDRELNPGEHSVVYNT